MKKLLILSLSLFVSLSSNSYSEESPIAGESIHLTFNVLGWQPKDAIGIKYPASVSKARIQADLSALAQVHGWEYSANALKIRYEDGKKVAWQGGRLSDKQRLATTFTLNFQAVREQFPNAESITIDMIGKNGFTYEGIFTPDNRKWQDQLAFRRSWASNIGWAKLSTYRIHYTLRPAQFPESVVLPTLKTRASFSISWLFKGLPILIFFILLPGATLYLFLRRGVSLNERGKVRATPLKTFTIVLEYHIVMGAVLYLGYTDACSALTRNAFFGFLLSVVPVTLASLLILLRILHRYEKNARGTTWHFRENLLTNLRMIVLGLPALLLPFCFFGTLKAFPNLSLFLFGIVILVQYTVLTGLFACVIPFAMSWVWRGRPLEDDDLRQRFQKLARRAGVNYRDILLLRTKRSKLANAWVAGLLPKWRSVFVSDYLVEHLSPDEIETVFAHELGHIKHRHLLKQVGWIVLGFGAQLLLVRLSLLLFDRLIAIPSWLYWLSFVTVNLGMIFLAVQFGLMRFWRKMEFEADAYAVYLTQQPSVFLQALRKLIQLNDAPEDLAKFDEMLSTHPNFQARAAAIRN